MQHDQLFISFLHEQLIPFRSSSPRPCTGGALSLCRLFLMKAQTGPGTQWHSSAGVNNKHVGWKGCCLRMGAALCLCEWQVVYWCSPHLPLCRACAGLSPQTLRRYGTGRILSLGDRNHGYKLICAVHSSKSGDGFNELLSINGLSLVLNIMDSKLVHVIFK